MRGTFRPSRSALMWSRPLVLVLAALPALCFAAPAPLPRPDRAPKFVPPGTIDDLAAIAAKGGDVARGAAMLRGKYADLFDLEKAYRARRHGGAGVGPPARNDGIEMKLIVLQRKALTEAEVRA